MTISAFRRTLLVGTLGLALGASLLGQAVAGEQLGNIKKAGEIKIGLEGTYPPFSFVDESGKLSGFEVELSEALAKELGVPVIAISQLNRGPEQRVDKKPMLSDLRESGAIEQDADLIGFLYKPNCDEDVEENAEVHPVDLLIAKQRNGLAGVSVHLTFFKKYTRFESAAKINPEDSKNEPHND